MFCLFVGPNEKACQCLELFQPLFSKESLELQFVSNLSSFIPVEFITFIVLHLMYSVGMG